MLDIGSKAPDFKCVDENEKEVSLENYKGKKIVLYFYPKDNTSGCTKEACSFRDNWNLIKEKDVVVIGVSKDSAKSHTNFKNKHQLPFTLIADTETEVCQKYGVWVEKSMYGKKYMGIERATFLIDEKGNIEKIWRKVKVNGHVEDILSSL